VVALAHPAAQPADLLSEASKEFSELLRKEVELAKTEVKEQASRAGKAVAMFAGMGLMGFMAVLLVSFAAAWGLAAGVPTDLAFLAVGLLYAAIGGLLFVQGRKRLKEVEPPRATIQTIKEDIQVAKRVVRRGQRRGWFELGDRILDEDLRHGRRRSRAWKSVRSSSRPRSTRCGGSWPRPWRRSVRR
jgi:uncharacterized membrane protein YqjE